MRITFNLINCGLANNGGSQTIVKSANTLVAMGHIVRIVSNLPNRYTWDNLRCEHFLINSTIQIPNADAIIATGFKTVSSTISLPPSKGKPFHWIRGWELWNYPEEQLVHILKISNVIKFVNGVQLQAKLKRYDIESHVIRPGYDFEDYYSLNLRGNNEDILGGLYSEGTKRVTKRTEWIIKAAKQLKANGHKIKLHMFGIHPAPNIPEIDFYQQCPSAKEKNAFYNACDLWLAPTCLEGLHMPPAEAMLTECPVIGTNAELSGMDDYLIHGHSGLIAENCFSSFAETVADLINAPIYRKELGRQAREKILSLGSREENMKKLVEVLSRD